MISKPLPVPEQEITSVDIPSFEAGWFLGGEPAAPTSAIVDGHDVELTPQGHITQRRKLARWLPDLVDTDGGQIYPVNYKGTMYYFTADDNKLKFCTDGDAGWTNCGGANVVTTGAGGMPVFARILDAVLCLNGGNGDKLMYIDLSTSGFPVVKYAPIADPTVALTDALTSLAGGAFNVYYAYSYTTSVGETLLSPILTVSVDHTRDQWQAMTTPGKITLTFHDTPPAGAQFRNLYVALAATAGTIQDSDMLQLAIQLDLNATTFVDDGSLSVNLGSVAPVQNSTDGPRVKHVEIEDGNPILYGDIDNEQNIWIGGGGPNALSFSTSNGGYLAQPEQGTNFIPTAVIGFRNGQGIPSLTVLYSNTEGLAKQAVLQQQTVNYGNQSFTVWGVTEQHYGAAGVAAPFSPINYNGQLLFFSTDGGMSMNTQPLRQNVISTENITLKSIDKAYRLIKVSAMDKIVGAGWNNKFMWIVPNDGFDKPQQIWTLDTNQHGVDGHGAWLPPLNIPAQWIGVVSAPDTTAFVYIRQGKSSYKLLDAVTTHDTKGGAPVPYSTGATGALVGVNSPAHNHWQADVQAVFYIMELVGDITIGVNYYDLNGHKKTKTKVISGPAFAPSFEGGWGDPRWEYANFELVPGWRATPPISGATSSLEPVTKRGKIQIDDIFNEAQWFFSTNGYAHYRLRAVSYEGINLGIGPDLQ